VIDDVLWGRDRDGIVTGSDWRARRALPRRLGRPAAPLEL